MGPALPRILVFYPGCVFITSGRRNQETKRGFSSKPFNTLLQGKVLMDQMKYNFEFQIVEKLTKSVDTSCRTSAEQQTVLNSCRLLTRLIPYIFEDPDWRSFFWSKPEPGMKEGADQTPLGKSLMLAICDLLFCPECTVSSVGNRSRD